MFTLKTFETKKYLFCNTPDYGYFSQQLAHNSTLDDVVILFGFDNLKCPKCGRVFEDYNFLVNENFEMMDFKKLFKIQNIERRIMYWCICGAYWF
jgi:hypothetical protein